MLQEVSCISTSGITPYSFSLQSPAIIDGSHSSNGSGIPDTTQPGFLDRKAGYTITARPVKIKSMLLGGFLVITIE